MADHVTLTRSVLLHVMATRCAAVLSDVSHSLSLCAGVTDERIKTNVK